MGLFDKIKKSLFGHKNEDQEEKEEKEEHKIDEETTEEAQDSEVNTEAEEPENESDLTLKETNKPNEETEDSDETPGWNDAGSAFEESQNEVEEKTTKAKDTSLEESKSEEYEDKISVSEPETDLAENTEEGSAEKEDEQERYDKGLEKTNHSFGVRLSAFFAESRTVDEDFFGDLEDLLIESDVGFETTEELTDSLRDEAKLQDAKGHDDLKQAIIEKLADTYDKGGEGKDSKLADDPEAKPNVYLFVSVNGAGKTTTIGKLAERIKDSDKSVMMIVTDTFRAGAVEQLVEWRRHNGVGVVAGPEKTDPASVVYDGVKEAKDKGTDFLLVDTAGCFQNKVNLMSKLDKIKRIMKKILPDQPSEVLLVLDGSTGQNALLQVKDFDKATKLTGLVLAKFDGSSKGGVILAIRNEMDSPVKSVGLGEKVDDLANSDAEEFAIGLFQGLI